MRTLRWRRGSGAGASAQAAQIPLVGVVEIDEPAAPAPKGRAKRGSGAAKKAAVPKPRKPRGSGKPRA